VAIEPVCAEPVHVAEFENTDAVTPFAHVLLADDEFPVWIQRPEANP
jgi:hypothetical protein